MQKPPVKVTVQFNCSKCGNVITGDFRDIIDYVVETGMWGEASGMASFDVNCNTPECYAYYSVE